MAYKACNIHLMFIVAGYVLFLASAVGGFAYLWLRRFRLDTDKLKELQKVVLSTRDTLDRVYLAAGLAFTTVALAIGFSRAVELWGSWFDLKVLTSLVIWLYYAALNLVSWRMARGERRAFLVAVLSVLGVFLLLLNYLLQLVMPTQHRF